MIMKYHLYSEAMLTQCHSHHPPSHHHVYDYYGCYVYHPQCNMGNPQVLENLLENCYVPRAKVRNLANEIITMLGNPEDFSAPPDEHLEA